jgi:hypothetical protein
MLVISKWETTIWYKGFIHYLEILEEFPKGTPRVFMIPRRTYFVNGQTDLSPDQRVNLGPLKWPVIAIFKNIHTSTGGSNVMRCHMRLGHFNVQKLELACELYTIGYKDQITSTDRLHCCPCSITKRLRGMPSLEMHIVL